MKKVITYGTFDLLHRGHLNILKRAKELGDYLIVGVTSENYDKERGKLNVQQDLMKRIENIKKTGLADKIIVEEHEGQKIKDILEYGVDIFAIGSDWRGKFDYLKEYCNVIYLERTKGVSSTELRIKDNGILQMGVVGYGRIAGRFIPESKFVSGVEVKGVYGPDKVKAKKFCLENEIEFSTDNFDDFLEKVNAVYIASPHLTHHEHIIKSLKKGKHVLCEKPLALERNKAEEAYNLAKEKNLVLLEAIKTAYSPGFNRLVNMAKSGYIGRILDVDATFTKLIKNNKREMDKSQAGGSVTELASYPLLAIIKILGTEYDELKFNSYFDSDKEVDLFTKINMRYPHGFATGRVGLGVKSEGDLKISGTEGYIYVPAPWWKTSYFELRFEDSSKNKKVFYKFDGDGLRYELAEFLKMINNSKEETYKLRPKESIAITEIIEKFMKDNKIKNSITNK